MDKTTHTEKEYTKNKVKSKERSEKVEGYGRNNNNKNFLHLHQRPHQHHHNSVVEAKKYFKYAKDTKIKHLVSHVKGFLLLFSTLFIYSCCKWLQ